MSDIEKMKEIVDKIAEVEAMLFSIDSDPGGYVSACSGHLNQASDDLEVFAIPRLEIKDT